MGPRLCSRGDRTVSFVFSLAHNTLQWGRGFVAAETIAPASNLDTCPALQWGRGFVAAETPRNPPQRRFLGTLQWGRGFVAAETVLSNPSPRNTDWLQWGRGFVAAETPGSGSPAGGNVSFNGAAAL